MAYIQFVSVESLKDKSVLQWNVDEKILAIAIKEFQDLELRNTILGRTEYDRIAEALRVSITSSQPLSVDDAELMSYVTPVVVYGALVYSIAPLKIKFTNKGTQELSDDQAKAVEAGSARENYAFKLEGYKRILFEFIADKNKASDNSVTFDGTCKANKDADTTFGFSGVYLPDSPKITRPWRGYGSNSELNETM